MLLRAALALATAAAAALQRVPEPLALWTLQEATGAPRVAVGRHAYALRDGNASAPVARVPGGGGHHERRATGACVARLCARATLE